MAAAILHDIGKLRELDYHPVEAKYTKEGQLIGHVLIGRDLVREAARKIDGFPEETLLLLEHAILAHHGKREFGAPIVPLTLEALLVSYVDDLDAKMNIAARDRLLSHTDGEFTDKVYALDNRRFYKGIPGEPPPTTTCPSSPDPAGAGTDRAEGVGRQDLVRSAPESLQCARSPAIADRGRRGVEDRSTAIHPRETTSMIAIRKLGWSALVLAAFAGCGKEPEPATTASAEPTPARRPPRRRRPPPTTPPATTKPEPDKAERPTPEPAADAAQDRGAPAQPRDQGRGQEARGQEGRRRPSSLSGEEIAEIKKLPAAEAEPAPEAGGLPGQRRAPRLDGHAGQGHGRGQDLLPLLQGLQEGREGRPEAVVAKLKK